MNRALIAVAAAVTAASGPAWSQQPYPAKVVRIVARWMPAARRLGIKPS